MDRTLWKPALVTIIILGVVMASGLLIRGSRGSDKTSDVPKAEEQASKAAEAHKAAETPKAGDPGQTGETLEAGAPAQARAAPKAAALPRADGGPTNASEHRQ